MGFKVIESNAQIAIKINTEIAKQLNAKAKASIGYIADKIKPAVARAIAKSPTLASLSNGKLKMDFGLTSDPTLAITSIIAESTEVKLGTGLSTKSLKGTLLIVNVQPKNLANLLTESFAFQTTEKGEMLPWLNWLTKRGDTPVVVNYGVSYGNYRQSRAGGAIMKRGGAFRVDPTHSGTEEDNFISKALSDGALISEIEKIVKKALI